jgi:hypothetical protein
MSFRLFIYYCALVGGWGGFLAWAVVLALGLGEVGNLTVRALLIGGLLGLLVAGLIGIIDAIINASGFQRILRLGVCMGVGLLGGMIGGAFGQMLGIIVIGWVLTGAGIGASIGVFDLLRAVSSRDDIRLPLKKVLNGLYGGILGGLLGGLFFFYLLKSQLLPVDEQLRSGLTLGFVILGMSIGLFIGLAQVFLKEAWVRVEAGFRPGREIMLTKEETTVGRAESCDIGLFGDSNVEKLHCQIFIKSNRYFLADGNTPGGTMVNDQRVGKDPVALRNGDMIQVGKSVLRFREREKRR